MRPGPSSFARSAARVRRSAKLLVVTWWRLIIGTIQRYRALRSSLNDVTLPEPSTESSSEEWNRFVDQGWVQEWKPRHGRGDSLWVRQVGRELQVFNGSQLPREPHYYLNANRVYRSFGHPEGPSSVPWFAVRGRSVYPGEGYPGGPAERPLYRIEDLRKRNVGVRIRPVRPEDLLDDRPGLG